MKKLRYLLFSIVLLISVGTVSAGSVIPTVITSVDYDGNFTIKGTGTGQIQIVLFDLEGEPLYLTTVLAENNLFSIELPKIDGIENGKYKVKIANYDGTSVDSEDVVVTNSSQTDKVNPQTSDKLLTFIIVGAISLLGFFVSVSSLKRKKINL